MQASDKEYMTDWVKRTGDFTSRVSIQKDMILQTDKFLGGQEHYKFFKGEAQKINAKNISRFDIAIDSFVQDEGFQYANGNQTLKQTIQNIKNKVENAYQLEAK